ncbi:branched-chain amino acid ABC transporter permease [Candidatus Peregrinibacteria bacterium]|nr:branched-chain amino acid ABC transporter permease [Candidatus Peregrinibacteria bacterium]
MFFLQILLNSLVLGTQILLIAIPLYMIYSVSKVFHLGIGAMSTVIAYLFYMIVKWSGDFYLAGIIAVVTGIIFSVFSYFLLEKYIERKQYLFALLASFSAGVALEALIAIGFGSDGKSIIEGVLPTFHFSGLNLTLPGLITIAAGILCFLLMAFVLQKTPFGRTLRSLSENRNSAEAQGINSHRMRFVTYLLAILMAGFIGITLGLNTALTPGMGFDLIIMAFIAFLIGGQANIAGTFIASYLVALVPQIAISFSDFSAAWKMVFVFLLAAIMLSLWPRGLFYSSKRNS